MGDILRLDDAAKAVCRNQGTNTVAALFQHLLVISQNNACKD